jgi:Arc/MetJ family transcription regulator
MLLTTTVESPRRAVCSAIRVSQRERIGADLNLNERCP